MGNVKQILYMTKNTLLEERNNKRVIMGFLLGITLFGYWLNNYMQYVWATGEPVNILEAFIVVEHHGKTMLFLVPGWLLIISDAPLYKGKHLFDFMQEQPQKVEHRYAAVYRDSGLLFCCLYCRSVDHSQQLLGIFRQYMEQSGL